MVLVLLRMRGWLVVAAVAACLATCLAKRDYYTVLGIERTATRQEVKKAFRRMALKFHPDKNPDSDTTKKFREVAEAYEVLGDEEKRRLYDGAGHGAWGAAGGGYQPGNFDFDDLFKDFDDDFFKEMSVDLKGHFASHFGTHKQNFEATGGTFDLGDIDFKEMFRQTFSSMVGGEGEEVAGGQRCRTVRVKTGNSETVTTQCETVTQGEGRVEGGGGARLGEL